MRFRIKNSPKSPLHSTFRFRGASRHRLCDLREQGKVAASRHDKLASCVPAEAVLVHCYLQRRQYLRKVLSFGGWRPLSLCV
jgi:hypothetical protein